MAYDVRGAGAGPDDFMVRRGISRESVGRIARDAARAEGMGLAINGMPYGHGLSVSSPEANRLLARDPNDAVQATRRAFEEAGLEVRYTPTVNDSDHHTVQLPKPVTQQIADEFNKILGRSRRRRRP